MGNSADEAAYREGKQSPRTLGNANGEWVGTLGGSANAYTLTLSPAITEYRTGMSFLAKVPAATTGASTLNVNGLGTKAIQVQGAATTTNLVTAASYIFVYDGTAFQAIS